YVGSHTVLALQSRGYQVVVADDLSTGFAEALERVAAISGSPVALHRLDLRSRDELDAIFGEHDIEAVLHLAGRKSPVESAQRPLDYYDTNLGSTIALCAVMQARGVRRIVFSSSATVYGRQRDSRAVESMVPAPANPYGRTKAALEQLFA